MVERCGQWKADQLAAISDSMTELTQVRNDLIVELSTVYGWSLRSIAEAAGVTHTQVANILRKELRDTTH